MGSLSRSPAHTGGRPASPWTPSGRRCSRSRVRPTGSTRPLPALRRPPGRLPPGLEIGFDETNDKLTKANESLEEADKQFKEVESDVSALTRRIMLMEEEDKKAAEQLCQTVTKLAMTS